MSLLQVARSLPRNVAITRDNRPNCLNAQAVKSLVHAPSLLLVMGAIPSVAHFDLQMLSLPTGPYCFQMTAAAISFPSPTMSARH